LKVFHFFVTKDLTKLGLQALLILIAVAVGLMMVTYEFGSSPKKVSAKVKTQTPVSFETVAQAKLPVTYAFDLKTYKPVHSEQIVSVDSSQNKEPVEVFTPAWENEPSKIIETAFKVKHNFKTHKIETAPDVVKGVAKETHSPITEVNAKEAGDKTIIAKQRKPVVNYRTVEGVVLNDTGEPLEGVKVIVPGLSVFTYSDLSGNYKINVPNQRNNLIFEHNDTRIQKPIETTNGLLTIHMPKPEQPVKSIIKISPLPVTGEAYYKTYLKHNLKYPQRALKNGIAGNVIVAFRVEVDGTLSNLRVTQSLGYGCDKEAIRLVSEGPDWQPATINGKAAEKEAILMVNFQL